MNEKENLERSPKRYNRQFDLDPLNPENVDIDAVLNLLAAIVRQGVRDYCIARMRLKNTRYRRQQKIARQQAILSMAEAEDFLLNTDLRIGLSQKAAKKIAASFTAYKASLPKVLLTKEERSFLRQAA